MNKKSSLSIKSQLTYELLQPVEPALLLKEKVKRCGKLIKTFFPASNSLSLPDKHNVSVEDP
jgi:hypothetical protein